MTRQGTIYHTRSELVDSSEGEASFINDENGFRIGNESE